MTRRMWRWAVVLLALAAADLAATIHAHASWHAPAGTQASLTLGQLLGFASSGALFIAVGLIASTGLRNWRDQRRYRALTAQAASADREDR